MTGAGPLYLKLREQIASLDGGCRDGGPVAGSVVNDYRQRESAAEGLQSQRTQRAGR